MQRKIIFLIWINLLLISSGFALPYTNTSNAHLSGKITNKASGESLPGVSIYFPSLKTGTVTQSDGTYLIDKLPATQLIIQVNFVGYKLLTQTIDLSVTDRQDFALEVSVTEISEVVVTGQAGGGIEPNRTPSPVAVVPRTQLLQNSATNIIDALSKVPGISQVTSGVGISKPVIRGLGYNRVVVVNDGVRQEGQQWGDEHGIELDENRINHVEILKGPASLAYGSDAMAGVINLISAPTLPEGSVRGNISSNYQTNNGLVGYSADWSGNKNGMIWDARYSNKMAHAYRNKYDGSVFNSGFREHAASTTVGINRSWGFSHLNLSLYHLEPGIVEGSRDSLSGKFTKTIISNSGEESSEIANSSDFRSYQPDVPFQKIDHFKAVWTNRYFFRQSNLEAILGFQQNRRKEFETPVEYGLYFLLNTINYDLKYNFQELNNWKFTSGVNGMWQKSQNKGTEFLVPAYQLFDFGVYILGSKKLGNINLSGGIRYDRRAERSDELYQNTNGEAVGPSKPGATKRFAVFDQTFKGISGSLGATYQISESVFTKLNISRGLRAPNIAELASNGVHEGTQRYETGNPNLKTETSMQVDYAIGMNTTHVSTELDLFVNSIDRYIFSNKMDSTGNASLQQNSLPVFKYIQGNAHFYGGEFEIDIHPHPLDWIHFENTFSYVMGTLDNQPESSRYLPFIPAPHWISEIKFDFDKVNRFLANSYVKFGIENTWAQNHFYAAYGTETQTSGYTLLNFGAGTDFIYRRKTRFSLYISASNLTDVAYQSHLSRLKYSGINYSTGRTGIFNQGRNISFKLLIPLDFAAPKTKAN